MQSWRFLGNPLQSIPLPMLICNELLHNSSKNIVSFRSVLPDDVKTSEQMILIGSVHFLGGAGGFLSAASPDTCLLACKSLKAEGEVTAPSPRLLSKFWNVSNSFGFEVRTHCWELENVIANLCRKGNFPSCFNFDSKEVGRAAWHQVPERWLHPKLCPSGLSGFKILGQVQGGLFWGCMES